MNAPGKNALPRRAAARSGMTLVEVLLAVVILGICLVGLLQGITAGIDVFRASAFLRQAQNVIARGEAEHPVEVQSDPEEDLAVSDSSIEKGWTFVRTCEPDDDEDALYVLRVKAMKGRGGPGAEFETVRLLYIPGYGES